MDRDLGALGPFFNQHMVEQGLYGTFYYNAANPNYAGNSIIQTIKDSGGLHYQWGRKDPIPVFFYPGALFEHSAGSAGNTRDLFRRYNIYKQTGIAANNTVIYSTAINEANYIANMSKEYSTYSNVDGLGLSYAKGNSPWYYQARFLQGGKYVHGIDPSNINMYVSNEGFNENKMNYLGGYVKSVPPAGQARANVRYGFILNKPEYNIGNFPNNGIRGYAGGNSLTASLASTVVGVDDNFKLSGIWTAAAIGENSMGMLFNSEITQINNDTKIYFLTPTFSFRPQSAMSCRCTKIQYDADGNEIGTYEPFAIPVPKNTTGKAVNTFAKKQIEEIQKDTKKLTLFPNPVKSLLYINADDKDYFYQIYNVAGQLVKEGKFENKKTDLSSLTQGMYLVRINNAETVVKIIKE